MKLLDDMLIDADARLTRLGQPDLAEGAKLKPTNPISAGTHLINFVILPLPQGDAVEGFALGTHRDIQRLIKCYTDWDVFCFIS